MLCAVPHFVLLLCMAANAPAESVAVTQATTSGLSRAVEEFKIQTANLGIRPDSPQGRRTQRGLAPKWHGRLFENFRNDILDALPHEIRQRDGAKSLLRRNQFGFNVGGPIVIPRLVNARNSFVSVSYEGVRERVSRTYLRTMPILPEREGDFSQTVDSAGNALPIYDPKSTRANPDFDPSQPVSTSNLQYLRDPFAGALIPRNRLNAVAMRALSLYPTPNTEPAPFYQNNYFINSPETNVANGIIARIAHPLSERHRLSGEIAASNGLLGAARWFPSIANPGESDRKFQSRRVSVEHVYTLSPRSVNTLSVDARSDTSMSGTDQENYPVYRFQPYVGMGRSYPFSHNARNAYNLADVFSTRVSRHSLRVAGEYSHRQVNTYWPKFPAGSYRFGSGLTSLPGIVNTGHAFASFLLGLPEYAESTVTTAPSYFRHGATAVHFRDQYEIRKGLMLTTGLSLNRRTPQTEKYDRQSTVDLSVINPANGRPGALVVAGQNGASRSFQPVIWNLDPSASLAWNPHGSVKTVVRFGYSRTHTQLPIYFGQWGTQAFNLAPTFLSPNPQLEPAITLTAGAPPGSNVQPNPRPEAANDTIADLMNRSGLEQLTQAASLSVERELPGSILLSVGATYSGGRDLLVGDLAANPNAISPDALVYRDLLNDELFNRSVRPYPQYKGFDLNGVWPAGRYFRDAGFIRLEKRASKGLSVSAYYEYSKQMDDYSGPYGKQDYFNGQNEWSLTAFNEPQRLQFSYMYELPVGSNKPLLNYADWRRHMVDGWALSGTAVVTSGNPVALHPLFNNTGGVITALRVNVVPGTDPRVTDRGPSLWFNPAAFDQPADFTLGAGPRTHPDLLNPGNQNYDLSVSKRVAVDAVRAIEISAAAFNFFNHANWNDPDAGIGPQSAPNVNAGRIIGSRGGRVIQIGMRVSF